jgi:hypothetical protein
MRNGHFGRVLGASGVCGPLVAAALLSLAAGCGEDASAPPSEEGGLNDVGESNEDGGGDTIAGDAGDEGGESDSSDGPVLENKGTWRVLDLLEDTQWKTVHAFGAGGAARFLLGGTNGVVALFDGVDAGEAEFVNLGSAETVLAVWATSPSDIVVAGTNGLVRHWNASLGIWEVANGLPPSDVVEFSALHGRTIDDLYLGGSDGSLWRFAGGQWFSVIDSSGASPVGGSAIEDIWVSPDGIAYVAAGKKLYWGQAQEWQSFELGRVPRALWGFSSAEVIAVTAAGGGTGDFIYRFGPQGWVGEQPNAAAALQGLNDVWGTSPNNLLAVGFKGTVIRYMERDGALGWGPVLLSEKEDFAIYSPPGTPDPEKLNGQGLTLRAVSGVAADNVVAVVEGLADTNPLLPATANLLHFRRHPARAIGQ